MRPDIESLIDDTLHGKRISSSVRGSCLVHNSAGLELIRVGPDALPLLEVKLRFIDNEIRADEDFDHNFVGLDYLVGAYLVATQTDFPNRCVDFVESLSPKMVREFIANTPVFFKKVDGDYIYGVAPSQEWMSFIEKYLESDDPELQAVAQRAVERVEHAKSVP